MQNFVIMTGRKGMRSYLMMPVMTSVYKAMIVEEGAAQICDGAIARRSLTLGPK